VKESDRKKVTFRLNLEDHKFLMGEQQTYLGKITLNAVIPRLIKELKSLREFKTNIKKDGRKVVLIPPKYLDE